MTTIQAITAKIDEIIERDGWEFAPEGIEDLYLAGEITDEDINEHEPQIWEHYDYRIDLEAIRETAQKREAARSAYVREQKLLAEQWENSLHGRYARGEFGTPVTITCSGHGGRSYVGNGGTRHHSVSSTPTTWKVTLVKVGDEAYDVSRFASKENWLQFNHKYHLNPPSWGDWESALKRL